MTVISTDGASSLTKSVAANVASGLQLGTDLTGFDLTSLLAKLGAVRAATSINGTPETIGAGEPTGHRALDDVA
jgi:flotillin